jgi:hypothetical protein
MKPLLLGMLLTLSALAQKIQIEADPAIDFSRFRTFAIREPRLNSRNPSLNNDIVRKRLDADIQRFLGAKGVAFVPSKKSFAKYPPKLPK